MGSSSARLLRCMPTDAARCMCSGIRDSKDSRNGTQVASAPHLVKALARLLHFVPALRVTRREAPALGHLRGESKFPLAVPSRLQHGVPSGCNWARGLFSANDLATGTLRARHWACNVTGMTVLEVGPADGYLTLGALDRVTPGGRLVCLDLQLGMLRKLREAMGTRTPPLVCASGSRLPFRSGSFDAVFLAHVLGEIPDRSSALAECARVLRPNGTLAITEGVPDPDFIRQPRLVRMASAAGFRAGKRLGRALHYTQRFHPDKDAA